MLDVDERPDLRRASLISQVYAEGLRANQGFSRRPMGKLQGLVSLGE